MFDSRQTLFPIPVLAKSSSKQLADNVKNVARAKFNLSHYQ